MWAGQETWWRARFAAAIWALAAAGAWAQRYDTPPGPGIDPKFDLTFPDARFILSAAISPDGKTVYAHVWVYGFNAWALLVHYWPEILGAIAGVLSILLGAWIARVVSRPRRKGEMHCRRCNYCLTGLSSPFPPQGARESLCPECAADLSRRAPVRGVTMRLRLLVPVGLLITVLGGYGSLWAMRLPRTGVAQNWVRWPSESGEAWLKKHNAGLAKECARAWDRIVAVDVGSGRIRTVWERAGETNIDLRLAPDGGSIFVPGRAGYLLEQVDAKSGRTIAKLPRPTPTTTFDPFDQLAVVGFSVDGRDVYVAYVDSARVKTGVLAWSPRSGEQRCLLEEDAFVDTRTNGGTGQTMMRRFYPLTRGSEPCFLSGPGFTEAYDSKKYVIRAHENGVVRELLAVDLQRSGGRVADPRSDVEITVPFTMTHDGSEALLPGTFHLHCVDTRTGEVFDEFVEPDMFVHIDPTGNGVCLDPSDRVLFVPGIARSCIGVRDVFRHAWVGHLRMPAKLIGPKMFLAPDGRSMAVTPFESKVGSPSGPYIHHLLLYDLSGVEKWIEK